MRALPLALALVAILAGCATPATPNAKPTTAPLMSGWTLDCQLGSFEQAINASWQQRCEARASHNPGPKEETWIGVNPTDPSNVIIGAKDLDPSRSAKCVWNGVSVTHDGGKTWHDVVIGGKYADRKPTDPTFGYYCNTDPMFRFTKDGAVHYGVEMYGIQGQNGPIPVDTPVSGLLPGGYKILLATSHDGGDTWPDLITYQPDILVVTDYSRMTVDPVSQAIIEAIGSDGGQGCHVLVSKDGGKTAEPFIDVQTPYGPPCNSGAGTAIAASPKGVAVLVGGNNLQNQGSDAQPIIVRSTDQGRTWLDSNPGFTFTPIPAFKESKYRVGSVIELAYDMTSGPNKGVLYASYSAVNGDDEADIFVRSTRDDGKTWSEAVRVNNDTTKSHQWMQNIAVAGDGSVHLFFMDKSYDPGHKLIDITHAVSTDGGKTWANERVSTLSYEGELGVHQEGFPFIGDYLGVSAVGDDVWAGFPDASNGQTTVVAAAHVHRSA